MDALELDRELGREVALELTVDVELELEILDEELSSQGRMNVDDWDDAERLSSNDCVELDVELAGAFE